MKFLTQILAGAIIIALFFTLSGAADSISAEITGDGGNQFSEAYSQASPGMTTKHVAVSNGKDTIIRDEIMRPSEVANILYFQDENQMIMEALINNTAANNQIMDSNQMIMDALENITEANEQILTNNQLIFDVLINQTENQTITENITEQPTIPEENITPTEEPTTPTENVTTPEENITPTEEPTTPTENVTTPEENITPTEQPTTNIDISNFDYSIPNLVINAGDTVTWTNLDSVDHTITSDSGNELDSAIIAAGQTYTHTFLTPGTYTYHCSIHPEMTGTVTVAAFQTPEENITPTEEPTIPEINITPITEPTTPTENVTTPEENITTPTEEPITNETTVPPTTTNFTTTAAQECSDIANRLDGTGIPSGDVCDVVFVRESPQIIGNDGRELNKFTLMNSVLEFEREGSGFYVLGDFALLETEMNDVLRVVKNNGWTVTGIHNHMILENPKTTFIHWETTGSLDNLVNQINEALAQTSIKG